MDMRNDRCNLAASLQYLPATTSGLNGIRTLSYEAIRHGRQVKCEFK